MYNRFPLSGLGLVFMVRYFLFVFFCGGVRRGECNKNFAVHHLSSSVFIAWFREPLSAVLERLHSPYQLRSVGAEQRKSVRAGGVCVTLFGGKLSSQRGSGNWGRERRAASRCASSDCAPFMCERLDVFLRAPAPVVGNGGVDWCVS